MTPLVDSASDSDVHDLSKCFEILEEIKDEMWEINLQEEEKMKNWKKYLALCLILVPIGSCFFFETGDNLPDVDGWWELTVDYKDCFCSDGNVCPAALLQAVGISFPSTRVLRVEFFFDENKEVLYANFYEGAQFLFTLNGDLEDTGDFKVDTVLNTITIFFDGSFNGVSVDGRTEMDYPLSTEIDCHGWGLLTGGRT